MRITKLVAENIKRIRAIEIEPDGNLVVVAGRNGQGKTSVLDAIWLAIQNASASKAAPDPIRHGEDAAFVEVHFGDLVVTRRWTSGKASRLELKDAGVKQRSPQKLLDSLVGRLSFDPLAFAGMKEAAQRATLLDLVGLPFDLAELEQRRREAFEQRTVTNRDVRRLEGQLAGMPRPRPRPDTPEEEVSVAALLEEHRDALAEVDRVGRLRQAEADAKEEVAMLRQRLKQAEVDLASASASVTTWAAPCDLPNPEEIRQRIDSAEQVNATVRAEKVSAEVAMRLARLKGASAALTLQLDNIDKEEAKGLREAAMPIEGLGFSSKGVTYNGVAFIQCCASERLRVSTAMAMALNPKIRVIRITDGSLLDTESMALLEELATANDFQCWVEVVSEDGQSGVFIEDGEVVTPEGDLF